MIFHDLNANWKLLSTNKKYPNDQRDLYENRLTYRCQTIIRYICDHILVLV